jgi:hypothetical protein
MGLAALIALITAANVQILRTVSAARLDIIQIMAHAT